MTDQHPSREAALFLQLVVGLQQAAWVGLGKLMNPVSGKIERNLDAAKNTIDTLGAIEARVRGNLEPDEQRVLTQVLSELRMNYLDELKKGA
ncbi:MAG: DUF1844 domain-containing protein [Candidatus Eisenbacteria bacterium]